MKAMTSIRNKINKPARTTVLFWIGLLIGLLAAVLQLLIPFASIVLFLLAVFGFALAAWQKIAGDREQREQLAHERRRSEEIARQMALLASELRAADNLRRVPDTMPAKESQIVQRPGDDA